MIGYAFCGSFCTAAESMKILALLSGNTELRPIVSGNFASTDTRFGKAAELVTRIEEICGRRVIKTVAEAEPLGPAEPLEALIIAPALAIRLQRSHTGSPTAR